MSEINYENDDNMFAGKFKFLVLFIILGILFVFCSDLFSLGKKKNVTKGMNQQQVVNLFYNSSNNLNLNILENCVNRRNVNVMNNRIMSTAVFNIRRNAEEVMHGGAQLKTSGIYIMPEDWIKSGKPSLESGECVEGIANLVIIKLEENKFEASYDYFFTKPAEAGQIPEPQIFHYKDVCTLKLRNGNWIIDNIEQL